VPLAITGGDIAGCGGESMENVAHDSKCILVVDDDPAIRRLISTSLRREGYTLHEARNGREALEAMEQGNEALVLLDLMMPEVSGWDVLRTRRENPALRRIPVIVVTASHGDDLQEAVESGICALLPKPFELTKLHETVRNCLSNGGSHCDGDNPSPDTKNS
jgi:CheY-like chemotaxis protein